MPRNIPQPDLVVDDFDAATLEAEGLQFEVRPQPDPENPVGPGARLYARSKFRTSSGRNLYSEWVKVDNATLSGSMTAQEVGQLKARAKQLRDHILATL